MQKPENHCTPVNLKNKNQAKKLVAEREQGMEVPIKLQDLATSYNNDNFEKKSVAQNLQQYLRSNESNITRM